MDEESEVIIRVLLWPIEGRVVLNLCRVEHDHVRELVGLERAAVVAHLWLLPTYSPDFNPIELCFPKLKTILWAARCRAREEVWTTIGACLPRFEAAECRNYFHHCDYLAPTRS